jgi:dienelactone hydrolase
MSRSILLSALLSLLIPMSFSQPLQHRAIALYKQDMKHLDHWLVVCQQYDINAIQLIREGSEKKIFDSTKEASFWRDALDKINTAGIKPYLWIHEMNDVPSQFIKQGMLNFDDPAIRPHLISKYNELYRILPGLAGFVLTFQETSHIVYHQKVDSKLSHPERVRFLIDAVAEVCRDKGKQLIVRTFAYTPDEYDWIAQGMAASDSDFIAMAKVVPWDFWPEYPYNPVFKKWNNRPFIQEHDLAGEYLGQAVIPCCMPERISYWIKLGAKQGMVGAVGRINRYSNNILGKPNEVNLAAYATLLKNPQGKTEDIWEKWIADRYGNAGKGLAKALVPTFEAVVKALYVRGFYFMQNHSRVPSLGYMDRISYYSMAPFDASHMDDELALRYPDSKILSSVYKEKQQAIDIAQQCRADLELFKGKLKDEDYTQLRDQLDHLVATTHVWNAVAHSYFSVRYYQLNRTTEARMEATKALESLVGQADIMEKKYGKKGFPGNADQIRGLHKNLQSRLRLHDRQTESWLRNQRLQTSNLIKAYPQLNSAADWKAQRPTVRKCVLRALFPNAELPAKTPLNATVTGVIETDEYTIEKVMFESMPGFWVTGSLYRPRGKGPFPAMINPIGHWGNGKSTGCVQSRCIGLVRRGVVAFALDTIGQEERYTSDSNHAVGQLSVLVGQTNVGLMVWDGMRTIDYLISRDDIDPTRIGSTGTSGGGLITLYLSALDDRIACSVPVCFIASYDSFFCTGIGHCICSHLPGLLTHADMGQVAALISPRPQLMIAATQDNMFLNWGAHDSYEQANHVYSLLGVKDKHKYYEVDSKHDYDQKMREAMYGFVAATFLNEKSDAPQLEAPFAVRTNAALRCGIPKTSLSMRQLALLEAERMKQAPPTSKSEWQESKETLRGKLRGMLIGGTNGNIGITVKDADTDGTMSVKRLTISSPARDDFNLMLLTPESGASSTMLWIPGLSEKEILKSDFTTRMIKEGSRLLILPGTIGSWTLPPDWQYACATNRYLLGTSTPGERTRQVLLALDAAESEWGISKVNAEGTGVPGHVLLLAAAIDERIVSLKVETAFSSYRDLINGTGGSGLYDVIPWILESTDLPAIAALCAPRSLDWTLPNTKEAEWTKRVYDLLDKPDKLILKQTP